MNDYGFKNKVEKIMEENKTVLSKIDPNALESYITLLINADRIFLVGVGRVKLMLEAFCKRLNHLGLSAHMVGDINEPPIKKGDLLIVGSGSGETIFSREIGKKAKKFEAIIVHITSSPKSSIAKLADQVVLFKTPSKTQNEFRSVQPMSTLFEQSLLLFNDAVALILMEEQHLNEQEVKKNHANLE